MNKQSGSAIFIILIAVALFAALGYAFMQGNRGSTTTITNEVENTKITELLSYTNDVSSAVKRLKLKGCRDTEISFQGPDNTDYENPLSPADGRCKVFSANGGGIIWKKPPPELLDPAKAHQTATFYGDYYYTGRLRVMGFGQDCANENCVELVMEAGHLSLAACEAINARLGIDTSAGALPWLGS